MKFELSLASLKTLLVRSKKYKMMVKFGIWLTNSCLLVFKILGISDSSQTSTFNNTLSLSLSVSLSLSLYIYIYIYIYIYEGHTILVNIAIGVGNRKYFLH